MRFLNKERAMKMVTNAPEGLVSRKSNSKWGAGSPTQAQGLKQLFQTFQGPERGDQDDRNDPTLSSLNDDYNNTQIRKDESRKDTNDGSLIGP